jgi:hypothetical protein
MNDFTKEELGLCYRAIEYFISNDIWALPETKELFSKLKSMIDNYPKFPCDHKWTRIRLLNGKEYDFCEDCLKIRHMR